MTLFKSLLLGSAVGFVAVASAQAADLPSKKAAPATYVKICDAYGAGFFYIPGTETCLKVGGRVRYDLGYAPKGTYYTNSTTTLADNGKKSNLPQDTWGQHYRGQLSADARTASGYGVVRTYMVLRLSQTTGVLNSNQSPYKSVDPDNLAAYASVGPTTERAFIQFAGFTVGRANSIFANGPSLSFGANSHFTSFANGTLQAAYTAVLGGGFSATIGIEDPSDHKNSNSANTWAAPFTQTYDTLPVIVGNVAWDQSWGRIQVSGAASRARSQSIASLVAPTVASDYDITKSGYAYAGFLTLNADMITKGDKFYLLGGYSDGINTLGFKDASNSSSSNARDIDGIAQSYKNFTCVTTTIGTPVTGNTTDCQNTKSTWVSAAFVHNWTSTVRQNVMGGVAYVDPGSYARAASAATQKATFSSIGTNVIWSPVKDFDIGVEVLYNRASVGNDTAALGCKGPALTLAAGCSSSGNMLFSRIRLERTF